jgi:hypothetical protein
MGVSLVAQPWWVNLAILVPITTYFWCRRSSVAVTATQLITVGLFATAFGFLEATVVVYLRAASSLLPGYQATVADVAQISDQAQAAGLLPPSLLKLEVLREAATIIMLITVALLAPVKAIGRIAVFLWAFAIWDIIYYASLWATTGWPQSIKDDDILFLIPQPWFAPVWFPLLVSGLTLLAILLTRTDPAKDTSPLVVRETGKVPSP